MVFDSKGNKRTKFTLSEKALKFATKRCSQHGIKLSVWTEFEKLKKSGVTFKQKKFCFTAASVKIILVFSFICMKGKTPCKTDCSFPHRCPICAEEITAQDKHTPMKCPLYLATQSFS